MHGGPIGWSTEPGRDPQKTSHGPQAWLTVRERFLHDLTIENLSIIRSDGPRLLSVYKGKFYMIQRPKMHPSSDLMVQTRCRL